MTFIVLNIIPFMRYLSSLFLFFLLVSCRSLDPTIAASATSTASAAIHTRDSIHTHDSIHTRDSIFESVRQRADTVFRERIVFRDRIKYRDRWRERIVHDTIIHTDSITQIIEHPPRKYIPPFYKRCTIALWVAIALLVLYVILRLYIKKSPLV